MARRVKGRRAGLDYWWTPTAFDNHKEDSPVRVLIKAPNERERRDLYASPLDRKAMLETAELACQRHVKAVEGYEDSAGSPIINGKDLAKHGETEFVTEIYGEIVATSRMEQDEKKDSKPQSDST